MVFVKLFPHFPDLAPRQAQPLTANTHRAASQINRPVRPFVAPQAEPLPVGAQCPRFPQKVCRLCGTLESPSPVYRSMVPISLDVALQSRSTAPPQPGSLSAGPPPQDVPLRRPRFRSALAIHRATRCETPLTTGSPGWSEGCRLSPLERFDWSMWVWPSRESNKTCRVSAIVDPAGHDWLA